MLNLFIDRVQLFVGGLEFLLRRLQLFVGTLQLLVARLDLLVGRLQFFICGFLRLDDRLQVLFGAGEFLLQLGDLDVFGVDGFFCAMSGRGFRLRLVVRLSFLEQDKEVPLVARGSAERNDLEFNDGSLRAVFNYDAVFGDRNRVLTRAFNQGTELIKQAGTSHLEQVQTGPAGWQLEIAAGFSAALQDFEIIIHDYRGGDVFRQQKAVRFPLDVGGRSCKLIVLARRVRFLRTALRSFASADG